MQAELEEYIHCRRDSKREQDFLRRLREIPEETRYAIIQRLLEKSHWLGLIMANGSLQNPRYFEAILQMGFKVGDASSIRFWLDCTVPKLGFRKVVCMLIALMGTNPVAVAKAIYWMPRFKPQNNPKADQAWNDLKARQEKTVNPERSEPAWIGPANPYQNSQNSFGASYDI